MKTNWKILRKDYQYLLRLARHEANQGCGKEICGFLIDNGYFLHLQPTRNKSKNGGSFSYYKKDVEALLKSTKVLNQEIIGTFHSHPLSKAIPGPNDVKYTEDDSLMLIFDCIGNEGKLWHIKNGKYRKRTIDLI